MIVTAVKVTRALLTNIVTITLVLSELLCCAVLAIEGFRAVLISGCFKH